MTTKRDKYPTRNFFISTVSRVQTVINSIKMAPIDYENPLEIVIREQVKKRKLDQNALMWVGPLKDIANQAYFEGRNFSDKVWHEHFKDLYLPDENTLSFDELEKRVMKPGEYVKYTMTPKGKMMIIGSTTDLTVFGMSEYLEQVYAFGASLGVQFSASPAEQNRYAA